MNNFKLHFNHESYIQDNKTKDFGEIYIQLDDFFFPAKKWTDFGQKIVFWWAENVINLLSDEENKVQCKFMDGNYRFELENFGSLEFWRIVLIREFADAEKVEKQGEISIKQITDELMITINDIKKLQLEAGDVDYVENIKNFIDRFLAAQQTAIPDISKSY